MEIREALMDAERERDLLAVERDQLLADIDAKLAGLDDEIRGLRLAIARHNGELDQDAPTQSKDWTRMNRTDAVWEILSATKRGMSPTLIAERLHQFGRDDEAADVSQTLQYLKGKGEVRSRGRGQWVLVGPEDELGG